MGLSLATFAPGDVIDASTIRSLLSEIELYTNEQTIAADRGTGWVTTNHIYRPDFYGAPNSHTTLVSGESYFRQRDGSPEARSWWSRYLGDTSGSYFPIPGLTATIQIPENIDTNGSHIVRMTASFYIYEFGGVDGPMDETAYTGAFVCPIIDGQAQSTYATNVFKGSCSSTFNRYAIYPRKQVSFVHYDLANTGTHTYGIGINPVNNTDNTKHVVVAQGNLLVRYWAR